MTRVETDPVRGSAAVVDGVDVDAVAAAVRGCAAVDDLYSSPAAAVASYLPGRQVAGVRVAQDVVSIQVRGRWGVPVIDLAGQIRAGIIGLVGGRRIDVLVADLSDAPERPPPALPAGADDETGDGPDGRGSKTATPAA